LAAVLVLCLPLPGLTPEAHRLAAVVLFVVTFWLTEAIPIPATALLGAALTVVLGIAPAGTVLSAFGDQVIFLFIGSFMLARAMQVHGLDRRIAYSLLAHPWVGGSTYRTLWALGLGACLLSMWLSNTACVAMLFPVALAIARTTGNLLAPEAAGRGAAPPLRYTTGLLLMLAYAGSVGGIATPVGTPPNLIGIALIDQGVGVRIGFVQWMLFGVPVSLVLLAGTFAVMVLLFRPEVRTVPGLQDRMRTARERLGPLSPGERNSLLAFGTAVTLWVGPGIAGIVLGPEHAASRGLAERLPEGIAALMAASLLFLLPVDRRGRATLAWEEAVRIDWGTVLLFGGGIALGRLMFDTGLAEAMGRGLIARLGVEGPVGLSGVAAGVASLSSETTSNTACANMVVPVMLSMAQGVGLTGLRVGVAATLGANMGFMLPVSTPPNAIVYGSGAVRIIDMVRAGFLLDLMGFFVVWATAVWLLPAVLPGVR
jgi:sodium-dependent dicarboxylate transporter 2/3/5